MGIQLGNVGTQSRPVVTPAAPAGASTTSPSTSAAAPEAPNALVDSSADLFTETGIRAEVATAGSAVIKAAAGRKVSAPALLAFVQSQAKDLTFERLGALRAWLDLNAKSFTVDAKTQVQAFLEQNADGLAIPDPVVGLNPSSWGGEPQLGADIGARAKVPVSWSQVSSPVFDDVSPVPEDVHQHSVGDCWVLSGLNAITALADRLGKAEDFLPTLIRTNPDGTYSADFYARGEGQRAHHKLTCTVDGLLPMQGDRSMGASSNEPFKSYPQIFEKLYAQFRGGYKNLEGGQTTDSLEALTGQKPSMTQVWHDSDPQKVWNQVNQALQENKAVTADTYQGDAAGDEDQMDAYVGSGLVCDHCYSVLGAYQKDGTSYLTIQNPWGVDPDGAPFKSDPSKYPTPPTVNTKGTGTFDISAQDFVKFFCQFGSVKVPGLTP